MTNLFSTLDQLYEEIKMCKLQCPLCSENQERRVRDVGYVDNRIVLVGEAPGREEIEQGIPFVGKAGANLNNFLEIAGLSRQQVYITNVVRCRPTASNGRRNRAPNKKEIDCCSPWLKRELDIIKPELIVTMGNVALQTICDRSYKVTGYHGSMLNSKWGRVYPVFHPSYVTYRQNMRPVVEADFRRLGQLLR
ncbi:MAG: uracil-DNA glycosylase [Clostridiaceae bacterium]|nr:uracil-DNA glycosylase [Clostridiaceae bacterium]